MSQKYAIAKNRDQSQFFTKSSSYDRPQWVAKQLASTYQTAELAEAAIRKLYKSGAYEARLVAINEEIQLELPDEALPQNTRPQARQTIPAQVDDEMAGDPELGGELDQEDPEATADDETKMVAIVQATVTPLPVTPDEDDNADLEQAEDEIALGGQVPPTTPNNIQDPDLEDELDLARARTVGEAVEEPSEPQAKEADAPVNGAADDKISVPSGVKSDLSAVIADWKKQAASASKTIDDTRGSFCLTVVAAFEKLQELLNGGTVADLRKAQVELTSWMNPITANLPQSVQLFVLSGGRKPTLKNLFDTKWDTKRAEEAK